MGPFQRMPDLQVHLQDGRRYVGQSAAAVEHVGSCIASHVSNHQLQADKQPAVIVSTYMFFYKKYGPNPASFCLFSSFSQYNDKYSTKFDYKSVDGVLGIRTRDRRMVGANESTELWRLPFHLYGPTVRLKSQGNK